MDILPLHPAGPQPLKLWIAVGGDAGELFDMLLRAPRDRLEPDDPEVSRPSESDDPAPRDRLEPDDLEASRSSESDDPVPRDRLGSDDRAAGRSSGPDDQAPRDDAAEEDSEPDPFEPADAPAGVTEDRGHRERSNPELRGDHARHPDLGMRDGAALDMSRARALEAARTSFGEAKGHAAPTPMAGQTGRQTGPLPQVATAQSRIEAVEPHGVQASGLVVQNPKARSHIEAVAPRRAHAGRLLVQVASERSPTTTAPPQALGGQSAFAAQTIAVDLSDEPPAGRNAGPGAEVTVRVRPTVASASNVPAKSAVTPKHVAAMQAARLSAADATVAGLSDRAAGAGATLAADAGARHFAPHGLPTPGLGKPTLLATGYAVQAVRPAAGSQTPADQVAVQIRKAATAGQDRINIRLYPAELGRIDVKMEWADDGLLRAAISVERSETLDLLQRDSRALHKALQEAGLKTDSGSLSFDLRGHAEDHGTPGARDDNRLERFGSQRPEQVAAETGVEPAERHRAHDGVLDLSV